MSGVVAQSAKPFACVSSTKTATQNTSGTNGTFGAIQFQNDVTSNLNGIIDRPSNTQFRVLQAGYYRASYTGVSLLGANSGTNFRVRKNATTVLPDFSGRVASTASFGNTTETLPVAKSHPVLLAANDYLELEAAPTTNTASVIQATTSFSLELIALV